MRTYVRLRWSNYETKRLESTHKCSSRTASLPEDCCGVKTIRTFALLVCASITWSFPSSSRLKSMRMRSTTSLLHCMSSPPLLGTPVRISPDLSSTCVITRVSPSGGTIDSPVEELVVATGVDEEVIGLCPRMIPSLLDVEECLMECAHVTRLQTIGIC